MFITTSHDIPLVKYKYPTKNNDHGRPTYFDTWSRSVIRYLTLASSISSYRVLRLPSGAFNIATPTRVGVQEGY